MTLQTFFPINVITVVKVVKQICMHKYFHLYLKPRKLQVGMFIRIYTSTAILASREQYAWTYDSQACIPFPVLAIRINHNLTIDTQTIYMHAYKTIPSTQKFVRLQQMYLCVSVYVSISTYLCKQTYSYACIQNFINMQNTGAKIEYKCECFKVSKNKHTHTHACKILHNTQNTDASIEYKCECFKVFKNASKLYRMLNHHYDYQIKQFSNHPQTLSAHPFLLIIFVLHDRPWDVIQHEKTSQSPIFLYKEC
eukprot:TRINITY_DN7909_c0_g1_i10.p1 TRINITY_DN7909_c0_g1~~TRINITY_DN7909_c0_g1_i10.p1  ORF type:complete len:252 (-),score=-15.47 TRINITY_DN7909_c0_g1_i10:146-901(-)